jgi:hypothetical protein
MVHGDRFILTRLDTVRNAASVKIVRADGGVAAATVVHQDLRKGAAILDVKGGKRSPEDPD